MSRTLYILAGTVVLVGLVISFATNGRQFYPALVVAIVLAALGLILNGRKR